MRGFVVLLVVLLGGACTPDTPPGPAPAPYTASADLCGPLPAGLPDLPARSSGPVPADLRVAFVLQCAEPIPAPSGARGATVERADGPATELVTALRQPSATASSGVCTTEGLLPFYLALVGVDGRVVAPALPVDGCGKPRRDVLLALGRIPFHPVR